MSKEKEKKPGTQLQRVNPKADLQPWEETMDEQRTHIWHNANEAFREKLEQIQEWFDREARYSIKAKWELGAIIKDIEEDAIGHRGTRYGIHAVEQIATYFGWDKTSVYNSLKLAKEYTEDEIDKLCERRMPDGQLLSYSHLISVISLPREQRAKLIDKAVAESWTSTELARVVVKGKEPARSRKDDKRGRPIGKPRTFDAELAQMEHFVDDFLDRAVQVWSADGHSLNAKIVDFASDDFTEEREKKLKLLAERMGKLAAMGKKLEELIRHIHGIFVKVRKANIENKSALKMVGSSEAKTKESKEEGK